MKHSRRAFMAHSMALGAGMMSAARAQQPPAPDFDFPLIDFHVHLDNSTIDAVVKLGQEQGIKYGIVEHAGDAENVYPVVLHNDDDLKRHLAMLADKPVYKGVQAEWTNWSEGFSKDALSKLDYVLTDMMTWPDQNGKRQKMWEKGLYIGDEATFMDRYVDWHLNIMEHQPVDVLANVSWLPEPFMQQYDTLWTEARVGKVVEAALKHGIALEISSGFKLPRQRFLEQAKAAGVKFLFGSNGRYPKMGLLDYSIQMGKTLGLKKADMFTPAPDGKKAVQRRMK